MYVTVLVRRLKPGKTYEDFLRAWYPDKGFGFPGQGPFLARNVDDPAEIGEAIRSAHDATRDGRAALLEFVTSAETEFSYRVGMAH